MCISIAVLCVILCYFFHSMFHFCMQNVVDYLHVITFNKVVFDLVKVRE